MKKLYFALLALGMSLTASATDYYLIGGFNNWALADANCKFTEASDGTYTLDYNGTLTSGFKINDGTWNNGAPNFGSNGSKLVVGTPYTLTTGSDSKNIEIDGNLVNPQLVFNPTAKTLLVKGEQTEAEYAYVLHGNFSGGTAWVDVKLTENNGLWVSDEVTAASCNFGIKKNDAATGSQVAWLSSAADGSVTLNTPLPLKVEGTNFSIAAGTYTFTFDPAAMTLTVAGEGGGDEPEPPTPPTPGVDYSTWWVNVVGDFNGWKDNGLNPNAEGISTHTELPIGTGGFKIKIWNGKEVYYSTGGAIPVDTPVKIEGNADANMTIAGATEGALYNVTFDCATNTLTVVPVGGGDDPEPPTPATAPDALYVVGNLSVGSWNTTAEGTVALTKDGDIFKGQVKILDSGDGSGYFSFLTTTGADWDAVNGADRYGSLAANAPIESEDPVEMKKFAVNVDASSATSWKVAPGVYDVTANFETMQVVLKAGFDAVAEIEAAEGEAVYYNLQGVQVENPANGVYVKVLNGKATKVVVK